jgi:DNA-binding FadR family transcriptional regulator
VSAEADSGADQKTRAEIAARLREDIAAGVYPVGSKLPSYRQIGADWGAATNTVGEAVRVLAREGLVTIRPQSGAVVNDPSARPAAPEDQLRETRAELLGVRDELRAVRRTVDELDDQVSSLIGRLPPA